MTTRLSLFSVIFFLAINNNINSQTGISGQLKIDTTIWAPVVYLSLIPDFEDMNTMSNEMIIEKTSVDKSGMPFPPPNFQLYATCSPNIIFSTDCSN
jgi:hypothetical protein